MFYQHSNLPPGCSVWDIPGNRPIDVAYEEAMNKLDEQWREEGLPWCDDCTHNHDLTCHKSDWFYSGKCPVILEQAEVLAREIVENY